MMATQESTSGAETRPLCVMKGGGSSAGCGREATERLSPGWQAPEVCAEHARAFALRHEADTLLETLEQIGEWRLNSPACAPVSGEDTPLETHAAGLLDRALEDYWRAAVKAFAASLIANERPEEEPLTLEQAERVAEPWLLADTLTDVQATLEDLRGVSEEAFASRAGPGRWPMVAAISGASSMAGAEHDRIRRELGRR